MPDEQSNAWSEDFTEHLRTVHFTLIVICLGLVTLLSRVYSPALIQLKEIVELRRIWPAAKLDDSSEVNIKNDNAHSIPIVWNHATYIDIEFDSYRAKKYHLARRLIIPSPNWYTDKASDMSEPEPNLMNQFPSTLRDFRLWWNALEIPRKRYVPTRIADEGTLQLKIGETRTLTIPFRISKISAEDTSKPLGAPDPQLGFSWSPYYGLPKSVGGYEARPDKSTRYMVEVVSAASMTIDQDTVLRLVGDDQHWANGSFDRVFPDLVQEAVGLGDYKLEEIEQILQERRNKSADEFEAFGMKFPTAQIVLWGFVLLLGVQLYLFIYLRQLFGKIEKTDAAWDVPWIRMNQSRLAQAMTFATFVVLPLWAVYSLDHRFWQVLSGSLPDDVGFNISSMKGLGWSAALRITITGCVSLWSVLLGWKSWRLRPRS